MTTLITRSTTSGIGVTAKNSPLTNSELDNNFISLNDNKLEKNSSISVTTITTTGAVGIGTTSPTHKLTVYDNSAGAITTTIGDGVAASVRSTRYSNDNNSPNIGIFKYRGTFASPLAVASDDTMGQINFNAYGGTTARNIAQIAGKVGTYTSDTDISSYLNFWTTPIGSVTQVERMRIDSTGFVGIGTSAPITLLQVAGNVSSTTAYHSDSVTSLGTIYDSKGDVRAAPLNIRSTSGYTTVATDAGKTVAVSGNTIIGTSVHSVGDMVTFYNSSNTSIVILSTSLTVYLAGTATTGAARTLARRGIATILCVSSNTFVISGAGLT